MADDVLILCVWCRVPFQECIDNSAPSFIRCLCGLSSPFLVSLLSSCWDLSVLCRVWGTGLYQMCLLLIFFLSCLVYSVIIIICGVGIMPSKQELNHCSTSSVQILMKSNMSVLFFFHKISPLVWCLQHHHKAWGHKDLSPIFTLLFSPQNFWFS